jgi:hypothetical protein
MLWFSGLVYYMHLNVFVGHTSFIFKLEVNQVEKRLAIGERW